MFAFIATSLGWAWDEIAALPLTRVWSLYRHWQRQPPTHVLLAQFLEYGPSKDGGGNVPRGTSAKKPGFDITPTFLQTFGPGVKQERLHPHVRKSVEEMQSSPRYIEWRRSLEAKRG